MLRLFYAYIMASKSRVLYTGVTNNLGLRVQQHKACVDPYAFTTRYRVYQLVYWEEFESIGQAIAREKQIKGWKRFKKVALIDAFNPQWVDFGASPAQIPRRLRGSG
jgi:putative endonuclease